MVKETGISIKPLTCNKSLKLDNIDMMWLLVKPDHSETTNTQFLQFVHT
jgi:hypothetical protein